MTDTEYRKLIAEQLTERAAEAWTVGRVDLADSLFGCAAVLLDGEPLDVEADR